MAAGMLSSTTAQLVAYPFGLVRTRLQVRASPCRKQRLWRLQGCLLLIAAKDPSLQGHRRTFIMHTTYVMQ